ncbi:hypothetical protein HOI26_01845 [Candidatus Woesearchaeota archaeon]|nr:hypothetical protein [Candidatus Woesearchaeota archaeon]
MTKKMVKLQRLIILLVLMTSFLTITAIAEESDCLYYFTAEGEGCRECFQVDLYMTALQEQYPGLELTRFEVYKNLSNYATLNDYYASYNVPEGSRGVPAVFFGQSYLIGQTSIENLLEGTIKEIDAECPSVENGGIVGIVGEKSPHDVLKTFTFGILTGGALSDSLTVCGLAILLIFLAFLFSVKDKAKLIKVGTAFLLAVFFVYFLFGINWLPALPGRGIYFSKLVGVIAIIVGAIRVHHFFKKPTVKKEKKEKKSKWDVWRKRLTSPGAAFGYGAVATFFSLSCTGNRFQVLKALVAEPLTRGTAVGLLIYYCVVLLVPLLIILFLLYKAYHKAHEHSEKKDEKKKLLWLTHLVHKVHLVVGIAMILLGLIVLVL